MARSNIQKRKIQPMIQRYGLAVLLVSVALEAALFLAKHNFQGVEFPLFLFAIALIAWYEGAGPAILALILSSLAFDYYFTDPFHSFYVTRSEVPYYVMFILFASLVTWFSAVRRRVETELLRARDELKAEVIERTHQASLLDLTHDTIFVRNMSNSITYWNRGAQELYGWTPGQAIGKPSHDLLRTVFPVALEAIHAELLRTGRWEGELRRTKSDGTTVAVSSRWSLRRDENEHPAAILETSNDISGQKRREEEIRGLNAELAKWSAELQAANKELEAFAYSVSHDLRAPLRHMAGFAELLQKKASSVLDDKSKRYMTMILESAKRMGDLIDDLLAFSRMGRVETQMTLVDLDQLVKEIVSEVRQGTEGRDIVWRIDPLPACYGDRSMLRIVLVNLVSNAIKFTRQRARAEIEIGRAEGSDHEAVVFVRDNGAGFDMKYVDKLFGVFQRLHHADAFEGTGIGLATVQRIIYRHGGKVRAEGAVDRGATFYFSVPKS
jgi:PAS domain S-box-containing protein